MEAVYENVSVLIVDGTLSAAADVVPFLDKMLQAQMNELVIIAENVDGEMLPTLVIQERGRLIRGHAILRAFIEREPLRSYPDCAVHPARMAPFRSISGTPMATPPKRCWSCCGSTPMP